MERELGGGGMSRVFVAEELDLGRKVVVKVLPPEMAVEVSVERFRRETQLAASLQHPHIVPVLTAGRSGDVLYYTMPLVEGETLRAKLVREGRLAVAEAVALLADVAGALAYAHAQGIVHRDIKPENVLLSHGHALVMDFGIAKAVREAAQGSGALTSAGMAVGTPAYMAPEQALGDPSLDRRCDIYAVGTLAYEMLAGGLPFAGTTPQAVLAAQLTEEPEPLERRRPDVPPPLAALVMRCLRRDPAERWQSAEDMLAALRQAGSVVTPVSVSPAAARPRRGRGVGTAVLVVVALVVAAWVSWRLVWPRHGAGSSAAVAVFPFAIRGGADVAYLAEGMVNLLSTSLDGAGDLRSVDPRALLALAHGERAGAPDPGTAARLAGRLGAGLYVLGDVVQAGDRLRVEAALYDRSRGAAPIGQASAEGVAADVFGVVDRLAAQLLVSGGTGEATRVTRLAAVTTSSLSALKAYLEGEEAFRAGRYEAAVDAFRLAVEADTSFALGYYRLSVAAEWGLRPDVASEAAAQAVRRASRLTGRDRTLLEALQLFRRGDAADAERLYRTVLATHPDDVEAWIQLGEVLFHYGPLEGRPLEDAREPEERVLGYEPDNGGALVHLVRIEAAAGHARAVDTLVERFLRLNPSSDRTAEMGLLRELAEPGRGSEGRAAELLRTAPDGAVPTALFSAAAYSDRDAALRTLIGTVLDRRRGPALRAIGRQFLAELDLLQGRWRAAQAELDSLGALDQARGIEFGALLALSPFLPQVSRTELEDLRAVLQRFDAAAVPPSADPTGYFGVHDGRHPALRAYLLGLVDARLGDDAGAESFAAELDRMPDTTAGRILYRPLARGVRAAVLERQGRAERALRALGDPDVSYEPGLFSPFFGRPLERYRRAVLLDTLGRAAEAERWYRSFRNLPLGDRLFEAPAMYRLGLLLERQGRIGEASAAFARVALLWKDCDPALRPVLDDARARLARLGG